MKLPTPPYAMHMGHTGQLLFTLILIVPMTAFVVYALHRGWRKRDWLALIFFIGGALNIPSEAIVDVLGACWFPIHGQWTAITLLGRELPVFLVVAYPWFIGGQGYIVYRMLERGCSRAELWRWWCTVMVIDLVLVQIPGLSMHLYVYYGKGQPGDIAGLPLHWLWVDAAAPMLSGVIVYRLKPYLQGYRQLALIPLLACNYGLAHTWLSWPVWMAIGANWPTSMSWLATLASLGLASTAVWAIITAGGASTSRRDDPRLEAVDQQREPVLEAGVAVTQ